MASNGSLPTIVIVQGSFQTQLAYDKLVKGLESCGYPVVYPALPSCTGINAPDFPNRTLSDDAQSVRRELIRLVTKESKKVVVVMHSYGGLVGSEAVSEDLSYSYRQSQSLPGGVIHLFYFSAFILPKGQSVMGAFGESPNNDVRSDGRFTIRNAGKTLYNDLPESEAAMWESRIILQSYKVQLTKLTCEAYRHVPSTYLICDNDQAAPPQFQETFAKAANAQIEHCSAGHSPQLSQPEMLVNKIVATIQKVSGSAPQVGSKQGAPKQQGLRPPGSKRDAPRERAVRPQPPKNPTPVPEGPQKLKLKHSSSKQPGSKPEGSRKCRIG